MTDSVDQMARDGVKRLEREVAERLRTETYEAKHDALIARVAEVEKDNIALEAKVDKSEERRAADRRLILTSLVLPIVLGLIMLYVQTQVGVAK